MLRPTLQAAIALGVLLEAGGADVRAQADTPSVEPVTYVYSVAGSDSLKAYVFRSGTVEVSKPRPAIVLFHGGGWASGSPEWAFGLARGFAEQEMVAVAVQYRLSDQESITPLEAMADAKAAFRWIRREASSLGIDPDRVAAYGWSAGAHLAASAAIFTDAAEDRDAAPDALVLVSPAVSLKNDSWFRRLLGKRASVEEVDPIKHVREGLPPVLILHGDVDTVTPLVGVQAFCERLRAFKNRCDLHVYEGYGHLFTPAGTADYNQPQPDERIQAEALTETYRFLRSLGYMQ